MLRFLGDYYQAVFGILILLILILMPSGLVGQLQIWRTRLAKGRRNG
jgi:ABC-type branched-subunit amino acid transport system permease subunit